jgi:hypothetical protein
MKYFTNFFNKKQLTQQELQEQFKLELIKCTDDLSKHKEELDKIQSKLTNPSWFQSYLILKFRFLRMVDKYDKTIRNFQNLLNVDRQDIQNNNKDKLETSNTIDTEEKYKQQLKKLKNEIGKADNEGNILKLMQTTEGFATKIEKTYDTFATPEIQIKMTREIGLISLPITFPMMLLMLTWILQSIQAPDVNAKYTAL